MNRLILLQTSPRVAPGLLTAQAWDALRSADAVLCRSAGSPDVQQVVHAIGVQVQETDDPLPALLSAAAGDRTAVWLASDDDLAAALAAEVVRRAESGDDQLEVEVIAGAYDLPGSRLLDLVEVMDRLRTECPWDREQTHRSLVRYLVEEAYETVEAIESGDRDHLREELGDLLLQVMFHSRIAAEDADDVWTVDDVAADIVEKLVRRHPHVFAETDVTGVAEVESNWESIKAAEKRRTSALDGIPPTLPALTLAGKVLGRAEQAGLARPAESDVPGGADALGDHLLAVVAAARRSGLDPEQALRDAVRRLGDRVRAAESGSG
ncbi:MAG: MazG family protein [Nocardioidaceae bacterium]